MRNRRTYLFIMAIAALAASCMKNEVGNNSISFAPVASKTTRSIIEGTTYPASETFVVSSFINGSDSYFENVTASYSSSLDLWAPDEDQYWPLSGSLEFIAYSPASAGADIDASDGVTATSYTIQSAAQMTTDFCYASAAVADCSAHPDAVPLNFSHALAQVVFRVKAAEYYTNATISMTSLSMGGIYSVGDFASEAWTNQNTEYTYPLSSTSTELTYDSSDDPETIDVCSYLFIPQELGSNAAITVGYSITQTVSGNDYVFDNSPVSVPLGGTVTQWEPGKKYIYTLNIGLNNVITISASAVGWSDQGYEIIVEES